MKIGSLFSGGIDGMMLGFKTAGVGTPHKSIDIDSDAVGLMRENYDHDVIQGDIRDTSYKQFDDCDTLTITAPCQYYSEARNMNADKMDAGGSEGRDLYLHGFRMIAMCQPEVYVAENVPEFLDYQVPSECFTELSPYDTYVIQADTADFNLPQRRNRLFFLGFQNEFTARNAPDIFRHQIHNHQQTIGDIKQDDPGVTIPQYIKNRVDGEYRDEPSVKRDMDLGNTAVAHYGKDRSTTMIQDSDGYKGLRPYSQREYARLQGIPDWFTFKSTSMSATFRMIGNSVSPVVCRGIAKEVGKHFEQEVINNGFHRTGTR